MFLGEQEIENKCGKMLTIGESRLWVYRCLLYCSFNFLVDLKIFILKSWGNYLKLSDNQLRSALVAPCYCTYCCVTIILSICL